MARVANELGFTTMSLYRYVENKDELLQLMWNASAQGAEELVLEGDGWRPRLRTWALVQRQVLDAHPWITQMPMGSPPLAPNSLSFVERGLETLDGTGLADNDKLRVIGLLSSYTLSEARMAHDAARAAQQVEGTAAGEAPAPPWDFRPCYGNWSMSVPTLAFIGSPGPLGPKATARAPTRTRSSCSGSNGSSTASKPWSRWELRRQLKARWQTGAVPSATLYEILDVAPDADAEELRAAFRRLSKKVHPDAGGSDVLFGRVKDAYDVLSDPARRAEYDRSLSGLAAVPDEAAPVVAYAEGGGARAVSLVFSGALSYTNHGVPTSGSLNVKPPSGAIASVTGTLVLSPGPGRHGHGSRRHRPGVRGRRRHHNRLRPRCPARNRCRRAQRLPGPDGRRPGNRHGVRHLRGAAVQPAVHPLSPGAHASGWLWPRTKAVTRTGLQVGRPAVDPGYGGPSRNAAGTTQAPSPQSRPGVPDVEGKSPPASDGQSAKPFRGSAAQMSRRYWTRPCAA